MKDSAIPYEERELIQRAINGASAQHAAAVARGECREFPRWELVKNLFCCGSAIAELICYRYGYDPQGFSGGFSGEPRETPRESS
jgi:hypothetical protein